MAVVVGLAVGGALLTYPMLERRAAGGEGPPAAPATPAAPAASPAQVAAAAPPVGMVEANARLDAPTLDTAGAAPALSPELRQELLAELTPPEAEPPKAEPPKAEPKPRARVVRRSGLSAEALRDAEDATAQANFDGAYAPQSTLSSQAAALSQPAPVAKPDPSTGVGEN